MESGSCYTIVVIHESWLLVGAWQHSNFWIFVLPLIPLILHGSCSNFDTRPRGLRSFEISTFFYAFLRGNTRNRERLLNAIQKMALLSGNRHKICVEITTEHAGDPSAFSNINCGSELSKISLFLPKNSSFGGCGRHFCCSSPLPMGINPGKSPGEILHA